MKTLWKLRVVIIIAALVLVAGGAVVAGAEGLVGGKDTHTTSSGSSEQNGSNKQGHEPTATKPVVTPAPVVALWKGKIVSIDCANGSITITPDGTTNSTASATFSQGAGFTVNSKAAVCGGLKVGWHVTVEVKQVNGQWIAVHITQDDSGQSSGGGGSGSGSGDGGKGGAPTPTPTPGSGH